MVEGNFHWTYNGWKNSILDTILQENVIVIRKRA